MTLTSSYCIFTLLNTTLKVAETCGRFATHLCITVSKNIAVVAIEMVTCLTARNVEQCKVEKLCVPIN